MKILFLCSSIEEGKDGVGDYTRLLAEDLILKGCQVHILALYDKYNEGLVKESQNTGNGFVEVTRISKSTLYNQRISWAQETLDGIKPDWISLQFTPYGFNSKGLPFWLPKFLNSLNGIHKWQIMFHELWIGRLKNDGFKSKITSYLQEYIIRKLLKIIKPEIIHTHIPIYKLNLEKLGYKILPLSIFSNIKSIHAFQVKSGTKFKLAFFSQVAVDYAIIDFINEFTKSLRENGIEAELIIIGGNKNKNQEFIEILKKECLLLSSIICTDFLNDKEISVTLNSCNLGITPVPRHCLGKSGSVAAFLSHGIPIAAPIIKHEYIDYSIGFFDESFIESILTSPNLIQFQDAYKAVQSYKQMFTAEQIGNKFMKDLSKFNEI